MYSLIVTECGISPDYFLDRMEWPEVDACLRGLERIRQERWEQTRRICHTIAQVNSTKKLKLTDVLLFAWDDDKQTESTETVSEEDKNRLINKARSLEKLFKHG